MEFKADVISHNYTDYSAKVPKGRRITSEEIHKLALRDEKGLDYTDETLYECTEANASRREAIKNRKPVAPRHHVMRNLEMINRITMKMIKLKKKRMFNQHRLKKMIN
jgi:hypothetical protein